MVLDLIKYFVFGIYETNLINSHMSFFLQQKTRVVTPVREINTIKSIEWAKVSTQITRVISNNEYDFYDLKTSHKIIKYVNSNLNLKNEMNACVVTKPKSLWLLCMDERIQYFADSHRALSFGLPGCECLLNEKEKIILSEQILDVISQNPTIEEIIVTSHANCGAVDVAIKNQNNSMMTAVQSLVYNSNRLCDMKAKDYASDFARILAAKAQMNSHDITIRTLHLDSEQLHCPLFHNAVGAVVNFNPNLNASELIENLELPMFNIYAVAQKTKTIIQNIKLALSIAASRYGQKDKFCEEKPFVLMFSGANYQALEIVDALQKEDFGINISYSIV
jgi:hypothetical protein